MSLRRRFENVGWRDWVAADGSGEQALGKARLSTVVPMVCFIALMGLMVPKHEPWADEAQAWELATSVGIVPLFSRWLHFEMTPGVWHLLLRTESALGVSFEGMRWLTAGIASAAVGVLLWRSPFPRWLRTMLPFGFFLAFQYALVARSYSLVPVLLFVLAVVWGYRESRPVLIALVLVLLGNTCAQALAAAVGLGLVLLLEGVRRSAWRQRWFVVSFAVLVVGLGFAAWCCRPPADAPWMTAMHAWSQSGHQSQGGAVVPEWQRIWGLTRVAFKGRGLNFEEALLGGVAAPSLVAGGLWCALVLHLWRRGMLRYLWPAALLIFFGTFTRFSPYHQGIVWVLVIFLVWVSWPERVDGVHGCLVVAFALCTAVQMGWMAKCAYREWREPYAPTNAAAPVLAEYLRQGRRVEVAMPPPLTSGLTPPAFFAVAMQPIFPQQPFANVSTGYWSWSGDVMARARFLEHTERGDAVVFAVAYLHREDAEMARLARLGYRVTAKFCGTNIYPHHFHVEEVCYEFLEPVR